MNGGRPSASAAIGGAIGTGYQRCGGQTIVAPASPLARPSSSASVSPSSSGASDCAGLRAATRRRRARASCRSWRDPHQVLPTSVAGPGDDDGRSREARARRARRAACGPARRVCAAESATRRREVPGATVGGRMAGTRSPRSSSAAAARAPAPRRRRRPARSATGGRAAAGRRCARSRARSASPSGARTIPSAASAAAASAASARW